MTNFLATIKIPLVFLPSLMGEFSDVHRRTEKETLGT